MKQKYDLVCIGGGPAGQKAAIAAGQLGKKVALIDNGKRLGGVSVHDGTVPSKTLQEISRFLHRLRQESDQGLRIHAPRIVSIQQLLMRSRIVIHVEQDLAEQQVERNGVEVFQGRGEIVSEHQVKAIAEDGSETILDTDYIVIATGSRPNRPTEFNFEDQYVYDSSGVLNLRKLPESLVVIGAGIIGCEYATIFANLGVQVEIFDISDAIIGWADRDISQTLTDAMRLLGVKIHLEDSVQSITKNNGILNIVSLKGRNLEAENVLISRGRQGNVKNIGLENVGLQPSDRGAITVNEVYQTDVPSIFAAGDVIGRPALSATSMYQGMAVSRYIFAGEKPTFPRHQMPIGIWTVPEVAMIGPSEEELKEQGIDYGVGISDFQENTRAQITGETRGILKLLFENKSRKLLGVHIVSEKATELLAVGQAVVHLGGTVDYFINHIFNYPTLSGVYRSAALDALKRSFKATT